MKMDHLRKKHHKEHATIRIFYFTFGHGPGQVSFSKNQISKYVARISKMGGIGNDRIKFRTFNLHM